MKFQPGQSGNPAGRPLGSRNKKTLAMEEVFVATAEDTAKLIAARAQCGDATAMRICVERTPPMLELPKVECADDAQKALDAVIEAFGRGAITVRHLSSLLDSVDRITRLAERIQQNREAERERYGKRRVHGLHPDMIPKPTGETGRYEALLATIERGEDPFPDDPVKSAYVMGGEDLYSPVNSEPASLPGAAGEGGSPERSEGEPGGGLLAGANAPEVERLYSPVNLFDEPPPGAADAAPPSPCGGPAGEG